MHANRHQRAHLHVLLSKMYCRGYIKIAVSTIYGLGETSSCRMSVVGISAGPSVLGCVGSFRLIEQAKV